MSTESATPPEAAKANGSANGAPAPAPPPRTPGSTCACAGVATLDVEAATRRGVLVMNTPGANAVATAEQVLFIGPTDTAVFQGQTVTGATTIAMYTYAGDVNFDGLVDVVVSTGTEFQTFYSLGRYAGGDGGVEQGQQHHVDGHLGPSGDQDLLLGVDRDVEPVLVVGGEPAAKLHQAAGV